MSLKEILDHARFSQVGFVVNDIKETKKKYALLFGVTEPETKGVGEVDVIQTKVFGEPAPKAAAKLAFSI